MYISGKHYTVLVALGGSIVFSLAVSMVKKTNVFYFYRDDLLDPGPKVKSKPKILNDSTKVDPRPLYKSSCGYVPEEMTVGQLKEALLDQDEDGSQLCLDLSQRDAILNALLHPLTAIQVPILSYSLLYKRAYDRLIIVILLE